MSRLARAAAPLLRSRPAGGVPARRLASSSSFSSLLSRGAARREDTAADEGHEAQGDRPRRRTAVSTQHAHLLEALRVFHARERHFAVPFRFVVPSSSSSCQSQELGSGDAPPEWPRELHGFPLGVRVHRLVRAAPGGKGAAAGASAKRLRAQLVDMGFPLARWRDYWFTHVYLRALETYRQLQGDLFVPQKFVVPEDDPLWPRATWGVALGLHVAQLRKQREELPRDQIDALDALGFVWSVRDAKWTEYFLPGLRRFHELHGHADVPLAFAVPEDDPRWPRQLAGYLLGRHVYMVRSGKYAAQAAASQDELQRLGFSMSVSEKAWKENIFPALEAFAREFGHCDVHQEFVVPALDPWPAKAWGLKLGQTVKGIRQGAYEPQTRASRAELEALGFVWNARHRLEKTVRTVVLPALETYARVHGDQLVSTDFVVPESGETWPARTRGFRLGHWISRVRAGQIELPRHVRDELDAAGFIWRFNDARWNDVLLPSFRAYHDIHGSCARMSTKFHVPHEPPYPRQAWGVNLGGAMWHIRNGDTYVASDDKQRELRALGVLE